MSSPEHISVLLDESVRLLDTSRGGTFVDATLGLGGHSEALLASQAGLRVIGIDQDELALELARERLGERIEYAHASFAQIDTVVGGLDAGSVNGILMDIGISSFQVDVAERGFSFMSDGPLDMRMDRDRTLTAADIVNGWSEYRLAELFFKYGEERLSRRIARAVCEDRKATPFTRTRQLADLVYRLYPPAARHKKPHPAARVFQALRIEVNGELDALQDGLVRSLGVLADGGILVVISFHSLEDRIVKLQFRQWQEAEEGRVLTRRPVLPSEEEQAANPRSRSAKLRAFQKGALS